MNLFSIRILYSMERKVKESHENEFISQMHVQSILILIAFETQCNRDGHNLWDFMGQIIIENISRKRFRVRTIYFENFNSSILKAMKMFAIPKIKLVQITFYICTFVAGFILANVFSVSVPKFWRLERKSRNKQIL